MILSSPFSRQNRPNQTWHHATSNGHLSQANGYVQHQQNATLTAKSTPEPRHQIYSSASLRKPAPEQRAPQRPVQSAPFVPHTNRVPAMTDGVLSNLTNGPTSINSRASTLNRLDLLKRRQEQQQQQQQQVASPTAMSLRRNLSSLGHYSATSGPNCANSPLQRDQIYAPASIASPRELASYKPRGGAQQPPGNVSAQQHYASTSLHNHPAILNRSHSSANTNAGGVGGGGEPARPESALGQLWERFGTLRRKSSWRRWTGAGRSWSRQSRGGRTDTPHSQIYAPASSIAGGVYRPASVASGGGGGGGGTIRSIKGAAKRQSIPPPPLPGQPLILDPEIYGPGKRQVEPEAIYAEGSHALDSNAERRLLEHQLDPELMAEGETRTLVEEQSQRQPEFRQLVGTLTCWINDELASERIIVRDLQDDLHDGQVLCKLVEKLQQVRLDIVEVTQNEQAQKHKLQVVLGAVNRNMCRFSGELNRRMAAASGHDSHPGASLRVRWSVEGIHGKNLVEILHLLITMALFYRAPLRLPPSVIVTVLVFQKHQGELVRRSHQVELTDEFVSAAPDQLGPATESARPLRVYTPLGVPQRDAFDTLLESAPPAKLNMVKQSLVRFCNRHLKKINMTCHGQQTEAAAVASGDLDAHQFSDGLLLVFLISTLEDYFVPLGNLFTQHLPGKTGPPSTRRLPYMDANNNNLQHQQQQQQQQQQQEPVGVPTALEPTSYVNTQPIEKLHNVNVALQLIEEAGLVEIKQRIRAEEIVNGDLKAVLRILYALFGRYKHL